MKHFFALLCLFPITSWGVERSHVDEMLATAAQSNAYVVARNAITDLGTNVLPMLGQAGSDAALSWQQRLVARICYERIARSGDIDTLRHHDWRGHPGYEVQWQKDMVGPGGRMTKITVPHFVTVGLWYYYIEVTWKTTGELAVSPLNSINNYWSRWCRRALADQPEQDYLYRAMAERLEKDPLLEAPDAVELFKALRDGKNVDAIPILVERYDAFIKREVIGLEIYPGARAESYRNLFTPILSFANTRDADLLEAFIGGHSALADLEPKLAEVRARPAAAAKAEPPFRLDTNLIVGAP